MALWTFRRAEAVAVPGRTRRADPRVRSTPSAPTARVDRDEHPRPRLRPGFVAEIHRGAVRARDRERRGPQGLLLVSAGGFARLGLIARAARAAHRPGRRVLARSAARSSPVEHVAILCDARARRARGRAACLSVPDARQRAARGIPAADAALGVAGPARARSRAWADLV